MSKCSVEDCNSEEFARGYCKNCYGKLKARGEIKKFEHKDTSDRPCENCGISKSVKEFGLVKGTDETHIICKSCRKRITKFKWDSTHKEKRRDYFQYWMQNNVAKYLWNKAKCRALKSGIEFNIEIEDIVIPKYCPVFGTELKFEGADSQKGPRYYSSSPSLDRIDNNKGYIKGNIIVMSCRANLLKSNGTADEFIKLGKFLSNFNNNLNEKVLVFEEDSHYW